MKPKHQKEILKKLRRSGEVSIRSYTTLNDELEERLIRENAQKDEKIAELSKELAYLEHQLSLLS